MRKYKLKIQKSKKVIIDKIKVKKNKNWERRDKIQIEINEKKKINERKEQETRYGK